MYDRKVRRAFISEEEEEEEEERDSSASESESESEEEETKPPRPRTPTGGIPTLQPFDFPFSKMSLSRTTGRDDYDRKYTVAALLALPGV